MICSSHRLKVITAITYAIGLLDFCLRQVQNLTNHLPEKINTQVDHIDVIGIASTLACLYGLFAANWAQSHKHFDLKPITAAGAAVIAVFHADALLHEKVLLFPFYYQMLNTIISPTPQKTSQHSRLNLFIPPRDNHPPRQNSPVTPTMKTVYTDEEIVMANSCKF